MSGLQSEFLSLSSYRPQYTNNEENEPGENREVTSLVGKRKPTFFCFTNKENGSITGTPEKLMRTTDTKSMLSWEANYDVDATQLYRALETKNWDAAVELIKVKPSQVSTWIYRNEKDGNAVRWRLLPIHAAIIFKSPDEVIHALLEAHPDGAGSVDDQGMTPLHLAFRYGSSDTVLFDLLNFCPKAVEVLDKKGRLPVNLHNATFNHIDSSVHSSVFSPKTPKTIKAFPRTPKAKPRSGFATYLSLTVEHERKRLSAEMQCAHEQEMKQLDRLHRDQVEDLKQGLAEAHQHLNNQSKADEYYQAAEELQQAYKDSKTELAEAHEENRELKQLNYDMEQSLNAMKFDVVQDRERDDDTICSVMANARILKDEIRKKDQELDDIWRVVESLKNDKRTLLDKVEDMQKSNDAMEAQISALKAVDEEMKSVMSVTERELNNFIAAKEAETNKIMEENTSMQRKNEILKEKSQELELNLKSQTEELVSARKGAELMTLEADKLRKTYENLLTDNQTTTRRGKQMEQTLCELQLEVKGALSASDSETKNFYQKNVELTRRCETYAEKIDELESIIRNYKAQLNCCDGERRALNMECDNLTAMVQEASAMKDNMQIEVVTLTQQIDDLRAKLSDEINERNVRDERAYKNPDFTSSFASREVLKSFEQDISGRPAARVGNEIKRNRFFFVEENAPSLSPIPSPDGLSDFKRASIIRTGNHDEWAARESIWNTLLRE